MREHAIHHKNIGLKLPRGVKWPVETRGRGGGLVRLTKAQVNTPLRQR